MSQENPIVGPEELRPYLEAARDQLTACVAENHYRREPGELGELLDCFVLFQCLPEQLPERLREARVRYYHRLYYMTRIAAVSQRRDGPDAGLEQQVFQVLETAPDGVDWEFVERIDELARS
jgi:hypothetical protein